MPNIASVLKTEISRLARKEVRAETESLKKATARYRSEIAELKRQISTLQRQVKSAGSRRGRAAAAEGDEAETQEQRRFSAKGLASHRKRLGLSAEAFGALVGVTGQSIYKWEAGKARPRASQMGAIAELRKLGKREAQKRLEALPA
ncbi:helix-turn-helix domain-containing protein [Ramlibacter albus]|uniref:Helix-turn-helix transcriptional regulator n=1 Tax=Ramlibacter albus TaxID=2079448 RepID=A0A923MCJ7_9BURK|nr:helix-turn-helix transcriptional regulator [Ramlibacter albus]MBC5766562.1 helix-turn-helix transcriptional regulator [Ramlibacter albus]